MGEIPRHLDPLFLFVDVVVELVPDFRDLHLRRIGVSLAEDHHEAIGDLHDAGKLPRLECERLPFKGGLAAMPLDRRHFAAKRPAGGVNGILLREITDPLGCGILPGELPDLLRPSLAIHHDDTALRPRSEGRLEGLVEVLLRHGHLPHELLERHRRLHDVFDVMPHRDLLFAGHAIEPCGSVRRTVRLAESHALSSPADFCIDLSLRHASLFAGQGLLDQLTSDQDLQHIGSMTLDARLLHGRDANWLAIDTCRYPGAGG